MTTERPLADVLEEHHNAKKTGAFYISVAQTSENLIRIYIDQGESRHISYGSAKGRECLDILDCYDLDKVIYFEGLKAPSVSMDLPKTPEIIAAIRRRGVKIKMV